MPKIPPEEPTDKPDLRLALGATGSDTCHKEGGAVANGLKKPDVRLAITVAYGAMSPEQFEKHLSPPKPDIRLALQSNQGGESDGNAKGFKQPTEAPTIHLAHGPGAQGDNVLIGQRGVAAMPDTSLPALLVSYFYLPQFLKNRHRYHYRDWVIDSGAFSAHNSGAEIVLQDYIDCCKELMATDPTLTEIYALDVIGDWKGSLKNTEEMWRQGVPAIPCFHANEPWEVLMGLAKDYPKIALGGVALAKSGKKMKWAAQCFARIWPKKVHGFAFGSETAIMTLPFHSVDATNWEIGPCKYGQWRAFGGQRVSVRGSKQNLRAEVEWYLELERKARNRWKNEMAKLESLWPTIRLAETASGKTEAKITAFEGIAKDASPTIRLAEAGDATTRSDAKARAFLPTAPSIRLVGANDAGIAGANTIARATNSDEAAEDSEVRKIPYKPKPQAGRIGKKPKKGGK